MTTNEVAFHYCYGRLHAVTDAKEMSVPWVAKVAAGMRVVDQETTPYACGYTEQAAVMVAAAANPHYETLDN